MNKCFDLARLPKAKHITSVQFRGTTPGSPFPLLIRAIPYNPKYAVDPGHPATFMDPRNFPNFLCPAFGIRAIPKAALSVVDSNTGDSTLQPTTSTHHKETGATGDTKSAKAIHNNKRRIDASIVFIVTKKSTDKRAVIRRRMVNRFKAAVGLIAARGAVGATKQNSPKTPILSENQQSPKADWILEDWTYVVTPTLLVYRTPMDKLLKDICTALKFINGKAKILEATWNRLPDLPEITCHSHSQPPSPFPSLYEKLASLDDAFDVDAVPTDANTAPDPLSTPRPVPRLFFPNIPTEPPRLQSHKLIEDSEGGKSSAQQVTVGNPRSLLFEKKPVILPKETQVFKAFKGSLFKPTSSGLAKKVSGQAGQKKGDR